MKKLKLPVMRCDDGCGECCGIIPVTDQEFHRVRKYIKEHDIKPQVHVLSPETCPFYQGGRCAVYPVRPMICQVYGHAPVPNLTCPRGYNTNAVHPMEMAQFMLANGMPTKILHDLSSNAAAQGAREVLDKWGVNALG